MGIATRLRGEKAPALILWLNRAGLAVLALAYFGTVPAAVVAVMADPVLAPLTILGSAAGLLWGLTHVWEVIPPRTADEAAIERLRTYVSDACQTTGLSIPQTIISRRADRASVVWCNGEPRLIFPALWVHRMSDNELGAYVAHELGHQAQPRDPSASGAGLGRQLVSALLIVLGIYSLRYIQQGAADLPLLVIYCCLPLSLTTYLAATRFFRRHALEQIELDADRRAVASGIPPHVLADVIDRIAQPELGVRLTPDRRILIWLLTLGDSSNLGELRSRRLREAAAH
jgi:hypothetical protein